MERTVAVDVAYSGGAISDSVDAVEGVRACSPLREHWPCRCPGVLDVVELIILVAHDEVQVACERPNVLLRSSQSDTV